MTCKKQSANAVSAKAAASDDAIRSLHSYFSTLERRLKVVEDTMNSPVLMTKCNNVKSLTTGGSSEETNNNGVSVLSEKYNTVSHSSSSSSSSSSLTQQSDTIPVVSEKSKAVGGYDVFFAVFFPPFEAAGKALEDAVSLTGNYCRPCHLVLIVKKAFDAQRDILFMASQCEKPRTTKEFQTLLTDLKAATQEMNDLSQIAKEGSASFSHHQNMLSEGIQSLGWVCVEPAPKPYIESYIGGAEFWGNKIRMQHKGTDAKHIEFVVSFMNLLKELMTYVKEFCPTGMVWNPQGIPLANYSKIETPASVTTTPTLKVPAPSKTTGGNGNAVFQNICAIDQTQGKTAGLKTVTKDMQTWRKEYTGEEKKLTPKPSKIVKTSKKADEMPIKAAVCELQNGKWVVEYQGRSAEPVVVKDVTMRQQVYVYGCINAVIMIEGKAKSIVLDNCKNTKLIFENAVSAMEIVNCKKVQVQCKGKVPSIAIDKTDGCLVYVSYEGKDIHLVTSKSSEMNVSFPSGPEIDAEYIEVPIPEQFVHKIMENLKLSSNVSDLYS